MDTSKLGLMVMHRMGSFISVVLPGVRELDGFVINYMYLPESALVLCSSPTNANLRTISKSILLAPVGSL